MNRNGIFIFFTFFLSLSVWSQEKEYEFYPGTDFPISGRAKSFQPVENGADLEENFPPDMYTRIDSTAGLKLPKKLQELGRNTAGLSLDFRSNSPSIRLKWKLDEYKILWNMTPLAVNGFDLYGWNGTAWQYMASAKPSAAENHVQLIGNLDGEMSWYRLYFPLYTGLMDLQIGVESSALIEAPKDSKDSLERVLIYGSSITQGASASRPGMAFPSIISRREQLEVFNFGFSGAGKMELEVAELFGKVETDLIVLDCVANPTVAQIEERTLPFVEKLRQLQPETPILMVESIFRENGHWDQKLGQRVTAQNKAFRMAYEELVKEGHHNIYYISSEGLIGEDHEATIDGTHLSDLGHQRMAQALGGKIKEILENDGR